MSEKYPHLPLNIRPIAALPADERIEHIRAERWIPNARADQILDDLKEALTQPPRDRMENILLIGESGMGKTMLVQKFQRQETPPFDMAKGMQELPVVIVRMPHVPTEKEFFDQVLTAVSAPISNDFGRSYPARGNAMNLLRDLHVRMVIIDELNSALAGSPRQQRLFLQLLRFLSNELKLALCATGIHEARHVLFSDPQLRSRFTDIEFDLWEPEGELRDFLTRLTWSFPLRQPSPIDSPQLRKLIVDKTEGITIGICKAFERAAISAIRSGKEYIDLSSFEDSRIWRGIAMSGQVSGNRRQIVGNRRKRRPS
jgi:hypothetical protein